MFRTVPLLCLLSALVGGVPLFADELVVLHLSDGSRRVGEINHRTDNRQLWLHATDGQTIVLSGIPWERIAGADLDGKIVDVEALRGIADRQKLPIPSVVISEPPLPPASQDQRAPVRSLDMVVSLANWDRDAEVDGIRLRISPLDEQDRIVPVHGIVTARLITRRTQQYQRLITQQPFGFWTDGGSPREYDPGRWPVRYQELSRWTERVKIADFDDFGATLKLPYRKTDPERDLELGLEALVEVTLRAEGQNVYRATAPIELRAYNPFRDELELNRGQRFLPDEP